MEFWYRGAEGCVPAVANRNITINTAEQFGHAPPTILVGRNGTGKTLSAHIIGATQRMFFSQKKELEYNFDEWCKLVRSVGVSALGWTASVQFFQEFDDAFFIANCPGIFFPDGRFLESFRLPIFERDEEQCGWETEYCWYALGANILFEIDQLEANNDPRLTVSIVPHIAYWQEVHLIETEADGEVDIASFSDNKYGERVGVLSTSIKSVWEENQTLTEVLQHAIKQCEVDLIDAYEATHGDLMTDCINALSEKTGSMLEDRGVLEEERELVEQPGYLRSVLEDEFPRLAFVGVDRKWGLEEQRLVDKHLIEHLVDRYSTLRHKFGFTEKHKYAHFGFEMPSLDEMRQAALKGSGYQRTWEFILPLPEGPFRWEERRLGLAKLGSGKPIIDVRGKIEGTHDKLGSEAYRMVMSKIPTVEFAHAVEVAGEMAKVAKKYRLEEYASCVLAGTEKGLWSVSEENMEDFLETYLEFAIALRICRAESKPSYALFQTHRRLMADVAEDHDTDVETFLNVLHSSHMPSGYQRLMSMIVQIIQDQDDDVPRILFIDEPEISMHIDWQEELVGLLQTLTSDLSSKSALIFATHSPSIVQNHIRYCIEFSNQKRE